MKQSNRIYTLAADTTTLTQFFNITAWLIRPSFQGYNVNKGQVNGLSKDAKEGSCHIFPLKLQRPLH